MYTISQFAKLCNTSTKTIRFYDNKGILPADYVSEENGYRFYEKDTVEIFRQISKLKEAGFTLAEIDQHLKAQDGISTEKFIDKKIEELKSQIRCCICILQLFISYIEKYTCHFGFRKMV